MIMIMICPGVDISSPELPACEEYQEPDPLLQATVSLMSGGGVGVGDSLDQLDTSLVLSTCRADGRLLLPERPLTATPLQLQRMAASCEPSLPHSCIGEVWSGHSLVDNQFFGHLLIHENSGEREGDTEPVSVHLLGLKAMFLHSACSVVYTVGQDHQVSLLDSVCSDSGQEEIWLPVQGEGEWSLVHTSPKLPLLPGNLSLALLGELGKINPLSGVRLASISVGERSVSVGLLCSPGQRENINLTWLISPTDFDQATVANIQYSGLTSTP